MSERRALVVVSIVALAVPAACASSTTPRVPALPSASAPVSSSAAIEPPLPASSSAPPPAVSSSAPPPEPRRPASFTLESLYRAGHFPWPDDAKARKQKLAELEQWNTGGRGSDAKWHPAPRVVISEPTVVKGKLDVRETMRVMRREQYWTVRRCYDPELKEHPRLDGRTVLRLSIGKDGTVGSATPAKGGVPDARTHKTPMKNKAVVACIAAGIKGIRLPAPKKGPATALVSFDVWPGDAPMPEREAQPLPGKLDLDAAARVVAEATAGLDACFRAAKERHPGLFGRLALRVDVTTEGRSGDVAETESTFPDDVARECAVKVLDDLRWPTPSGEARIVVAFRVGAP